MTKFTNESSRDINFEVVGAGSIRISKSSNWHPGIMVLLVVF